MSFFRKLFGGKPANNEPEIVEAYNGCQIAPNPIAENGQFRLSALVMKEVDGVTKTHHLIRADLFTDRESAKTAAINKARQVIDEQGDGLFG